MALDHLRLIRPGKKSGRIFCVRQVYFTKSCQQIWVRVNQPFIPFIHHIWGETVLWGTVFIIQTSDIMQYFTILQYKLHSFNIRSTRGLLPIKPVKKFPKSHIRPPSSHFCLLLLFPSDFSTLTHQARWKTKTRPSKSDFRLWQLMYFLTKNQLNNRRLLSWLLAAEFHFVHPVEKDSSSQVDTRLCQLQLSK